MGDNFFYGNNLYQVVDDAVKNNKGATIFGYDVQDPERFGVIEYDKKGQVKKLIEKLKNPPPIKLQLVYTSIKVMLLI